MEAETTVVVKLVTVGTSKDKDVSSAVIIVRFMNRPARLE